MDPSLRRFGVLVLGGVLVLSGCARHNAISRAAVESTTTATSSATTSETAIATTTAAAQTGSDDYEDPSEKFARALPKGHAVQRGEPERSAILGTLRVPVEKDLHQAVRFEVYTIRTASQFAGVMARPVRPNGDRMDYSHTQYQEWIDEGAFDDELIALLKRTNGKWRVVEYEMGVTDYPGDAWLYKHHVPANVFAH